MNTERQPQGIAPSEKITQEKAGIEEHLKTGKIKILGTIDDFFNASPHSNEVLVASVFSNMSHVVKVQSTEGEFLAVLKPSSGENKGLKSKAQLAENESFCTREAIAYKVAEGLGFNDIVPPTVLRRVEIDGKQVLCSLQSLVDHEDFSVIGNTEFITDDDFHAAISSPEGQMIAALDWIIGNVDRNGNNWMVAKKRVNGKRKIYAIDHGFSMTPAYYSSTRSILEEVSTEHPEIYRGGGPSLFLTCNILKEEGERGKREKISEEIMKKLRDLNKDEAKKAEITASIQEQFAEEIESLERDLPDEVCASIIESQKGKLLSDIQMLKAEIADCESHYTLPPSGVLARMKTLEEDLLAYEGKDPSHYREEKKEQLEKKHMLEINKMWERLSLLVEHGVFLSPFNLQQIIVQ